MVSQIRLITIFLSITTYIGDNQAAYKEGYSPKVDTAKFCKDEYKCQKRFEHSTCTYKCELGPNCNNFKAWELDNERRQYVLDMHNFLRNLVAVGNETRGFLKSSSNMKVLNYERAHEPVAHCWMKRCTFDHDKCRSIKGFNVVGQNAASHGLVKETAETDASAWEIINDSVHGWYVEVEEMIEGDIDKMRATVPGSKEQIGHATQLFWANSQNMGCTLTAHDHLKHEDRLQWLFYCNYAPSGNYENKPVYKRGAPGSECQSLYNLKISDEYSGLCGDMYMVSKQRKKMEINIKGETFTHAPRLDGKENIISDDDDDYIPFDYDNKAYTTQISIFLLITPILIPIIMLSIVIYNV